MGLQLSGLQAMHCAGLALWVGNGQVLYCNGGGLKRYMYSLRLYSLDVGGSGLVSIIIMQWTAVPLGCSYAL